MRSRAVARTVPTKRGVVRVDEADGRERQVRRVERARAVGLREGAELRVVALAQHLRADVVALGPPALEVLVVEPVEVGERDRPVERHPAHDLGVDEVLRIAADLPDALVGLAPLAHGSVGERADEPPAVRVELILEAGADHPDRVGQLPVGVDLALLGGTVAHADRP
jgi:hypothetical protein